MNNCITIVCPGCKKERLVQSNNAQKVGHTGLCRECWLKEIKTHKTPHINKHSMIICSVCNQSREVSIYNQKMPRFTGVCNKCKGILYKKEQKTKVCLQCGIVFPKKSEWAKEHWAIRKYCSPQCYSDSKKGHYPVGIAERHAKTVTLICPDCGKERTVSDCKAKNFKSELCRPCSVKRKSNAYHLKQTSRSMEERPVHKRPDGYLEVSLPVGHWCWPMAQKSKGCIMMHRLVMAEHLHRLLLRTEYCSSHQRSTR
jgi:hypothetical protein